MSENNSYLRSENNQLAFPLFRVQPKDLSSLVVFLQLIYSYLEHQSYLGMVDGKEEIIELTQDDFVKKLGDLYRERIVEVNGHGKRNAWSEVVNGYSTLVDKVCDLKSDFLLLKPEIAQKLLELDKPIDKP